MGVGLGTGCGRTELEVPPYPKPQNECEIDADCPGFDNFCAPTRCVRSDDYRDRLPAIPLEELAARFGVEYVPDKICLVLDEVVCDDGNVCTEDICDPELGECQYAPATLDLDGDGHRAPRPGTQPGAPDACGDDCDDSNENAFPGNLPEICDGVDNDCNGVVDDGANFIPLQEEPVRVSENAPPYSPGGLAYNGTDYLSIYTSGNSDITMFETRLDPLANKLPPIEQPFTFQNADASGGPIIWVGDRYGVAWQDRRDGIYEAYFTILKADGTKAIADQRLSFSGSVFSVNVDLTWNGTEFIVVWQDDVEGPFQILGQRVSVDGVRIGENVSLSLPGGAEDESPSIDSGVQTLGLAFTNGNAGTQLVRFKTLQQTTLEDASPLIDLSVPGNQAVYPDVVWNQDRYIVTWYERSVPPFAIYAATVSEDGTVLTPPTKISQPSDMTTIARSPTLLPLGDRSLFIYAHNADDPQGRHELYSRMVDQDLQPMGPELRITNALQDSVEPIATFGPDGNVAILFRDDRLGQPHVWFTRLGCVTAP
ncbi:MAG: putative metal-binding motif-containing protein [Polyangiaceae bacterium]